MFVVGTRSSQWSNVIVREGRRLPEPREADGNAPVRALPNFVDGFSGTEDEGTEF